MATIKKGKAAQPQDRLVTRVYTNDKGELIILLWNTELERMETLTFTREEAERIEIGLSK